MKAVLAALALAVAGPAAAFECHTALVLGLDASQSIDAQESRLQREGLAAALTSPEIMAAIAPFPDYGVAAMAFEWSAPEDQVVIAPWSVLRDKATIRAFARRLSESPGVAQPQKTGIGPAMRFAAGAFAAAPANCRRRVIDISGDGPGNVGVPPEIHREDGVFDGLTINGLVIRHPSLDSAQPPDKDPLPYYQTFVVQGPGAFVEVTRSYDEYPEAIRRKLLRELTPTLAMK